MTDKKIINLFNLMIKKNNLPFNDGKIVMLFDEDKDEFGYYVIVKFDFNGSDGSKISESDIIDLTNTIYKLVNSKKVNLEYYGFTLHKKEKFFEIKIIFFP